MIENLSIFAILSEFPQRNDVVSANLGFVSIGKRYTMLASVLLPLAVLLFVKTKS